MDSFPLFQPSSLTVSELTRYMRNLLDSDTVLSDVWVRGEISNFSRPSSGHLYFTLKDGGAALRCVIWRSTAIRLRFGFQNGIAIEAHGAVSIYERDGAYQLYIDAVRPAGEGLLFQEFLRLKTRLEAEGLFDPERKRPIPERPARIAIITSPTGAALQDMLNTLQNRYPLAEVILAPCAVQGDSAPGEIAAAIRAACRVTEPDVVIVARGGGSLEDLWAFNDERVVRAIAACPVPVITGVGHETDFTLSDFASDLRAPTPTGAAVLATPDRSDLMAELVGVNTRLVGAALGIIATYDQELGATRQRLEWASPERHIQNERQGIDNLQSRAERALRHNFQLKRAHLAGAQNRIEALNPSAILQRGFAVVQDSQGQLVRSVGDTTTGELINIRLSDGALSSTVEKIEPDETE